MAYSYPPPPLDKVFNFTKTIHQDTYPAIDPSTKADFGNKYVFITGASKGIGRSIAVSFAKAGALGIGISGLLDLSEVEIEIRNAAKAAGREPPHVLKINLDVTDEASVINAAEQLEEHFGRLDILINNAGYLSNFMPLIDGDSSDWWTNWEVNIRGVYLITKAFLPVLLKAGDKTIVNLSSVGAHLIIPGASGYQTSKFALLRLTESLCADYSSQGLLAYCIHPGAVMTDMGGKLPKEAMETLNDKPELAGDTVTSLTSSRREWLAGRYVSATWDMPELYSREEIVKGDKLKMRMTF